MTAVHLGRLFDFLEIAYEGRKPKADLEVFRSLLKYAFDEQCTQEFMEECVRNRYTDRDVPVETLSSSSQQGSCDAEDFNFDADSDSDREVQEEIAEMKRRVAKQKSRCDAKIEELRT